ncbi:oxidoreductase-like protein [Aspergillus desertorum]
MESHAQVVIRHSLFTSSRASPLSSIRTSLAQNRRRRISFPECLLHHRAKPDTNRLADSQVYPLSGYYSDILSARRSHRGQATTSLSAPEQKLETPRAETGQLPQSPEERMAIVFGTRLAGPGRSSRYNRDSNSAWKTVNGVPIPPRPEEPDNCCMSGCVHCVWDDYRDEMEEWAALLAQAKAKGGTSKSSKVVPSAIPKAPVDGAASTSVDDDGGGSETNWSLPGSADDLFAGIPVGIREFMRTEKRLKQIHRDAGNV